MKRFLFLFLCITIYNPLYPSAAAGAGADAQQQLPSKLKLFQLLIGKCDSITNMFGPLANPQHLDQEAQALLKPKLEEEPALSTIDLHFIARGVYHKEQFLRTLKAFNINLPEATPKEVELAHCAYLWSDEQVTELLEQGANPYVPVLGLSFCDHIAHKYDSWTRVGFDECIQEAWKKFDASDRGKRLLALHRSLPDYRQARKRLKLRATFNALAHDIQPGNKQELDHDHAYNEFREVLAGVKLSDSDIAQSLAPALGKDLQAALCADPKQSIVKARPKFMQTLQDFKHALDAQEYSINDVMGLVPNFARNA